MLFFFSFFFLSVLFAFFKLFNAVKTDTKLILHHKENFNLRRKNITWRIIFFKFFTTEKLWIGLDFWDGHKGVNSVLGEKITFEIIYPARGELRFSVVLASPPVGVLKCKRSACA